MHSLKQGTCQLWSSCCHCRKLLWREWIPAPVCGTNLAANLLDQETHSTKHFLTAGSANRDLLCITLVSDISWKLSIFLSRMERMWTGRITMVTLHFWLCWKKLFAVRDFPRFFELLNVCGLHPFTVFFLGKVSALLYIQAKIKNPFSQKGQTEHVRHSGRSCGSWNWHVSVREIYSHLQCLHNR